MKGRNLRDLAKRVAAAEAEPLRQALRYIVRNTSLAPRARAQAQLQLSNMPSKTRIGQVKNRCVETGRGRGILRDFRLCRYQFRLKALDGELPGVKKASW
ncbi:40S ribosomal protein mrp2, mitochondrial [Savitreella phatthalungensis]